MIAWTRCKKAMKLVKRVRERKKQRVFFHADNSVVIGMMVIFICWTLSVERVRIVKVEKLFPRQCVIKGQYYSFHRTMFNVQVYCICSHITVKQYQRHALKCTRAQVFVVFSKADQHKMLRFFFKRGKNWSIEGKLKIVCVNVDWYIWQVANNLIEN